MEETAGFAAESKEPFEAQFLKLAGSLGFQSGVKVKSGTHGQEWHGKTKSIFVNPHLLARASQAYENNVCSGGPNICGYLIGLLFTEKTKEAGATTRNA